MRRLFLLTISTIIFCTSAGYKLVLAQDIKTTVDELEDVQVVEKLGDTPDLNLSFINQDGQTVLIKDLISNDKPTILSLVYFECPMLCTLVLNGLTEVIESSKFRAGKDFNIISVSIDDQETPELAKQKQNIYTQEIELEDKMAWSFLTGNKANIAALADSVGFNFKYEDEIDEYAHPAVFMVLSPSGKISRYFYGVKHEKINFELALTEASEGKIGSTFDKFLLYCYRYDPDSKGYVLFAWRLMRTAGLLSILFLFGFLAVFWKKEKRLMDIKRDKIAD